MIPRTPGSWPWPRSITVSRPGTCRGCSYHERVTDPEVASRVSECCTHPEGPPYVEPDDAPPPSCPLPDEETPFGPVEPLPPLSEAQRRSIARLAARARARGDHEAADQGDAVLFLDQRDRETLRPPTRAWETFLDRMADLVTDEAAPWARPDLALRRTRIVLSALADAMSVSEQLARRLRTSAARSAFGLPRPSTSGGDQARLWTLRDPATVRATAWTDRPVLRSLHRTTRSPLY